MQAQTEEYKILYMLIYRMKNIDSSWLKDFSVGH
jgi:hypothetical protein